MSKGAPAAALRFPTVGAPGAKANSYLGSRPRSGLRPISAVVAPGMNKLKRRNKTPRRINLTIPKQTTFWWQKFNYLTEQSKKFCYEHK